MILTLQIRLLFFLKVDNNRSIKTSNNLDDKQEVAFAASCFLHVFAMVKTAFLLCFEWKDCAEQTQQTIK